MNVTGEPITARQRRSVTKTLFAAMWMYGGRGIGLLWTLALINKLGIGEYGTYAMGFALAAIAAAPLDNPFNVRAIRESEERFLAERTARLLMGLAIMIAGLALIGVNYIAWFGLVVAGGELMFNTLKSRDLRDGHPDRIMRIDTIRQSTSIGLGCAYLFLAPQPTLLGASLLYVAPYLVIAVVTAATVRKHRPAIPGPPRLVAALVAEHLGNALYVQGDILLLGFLTDSTVAGYYSVASVLAWAVAAIGQSYATTFHEPLRLAGGALSAGPPPRTIAIVGLLAGTTVGVVGIGLLISPAPTQLAVSMMIMAVFCAMRAVNYVYTAVLYMQKRDLVRATSAVALAPVKLALVAGLVALGAVGASIASVVTDAILLAIYLVVLYRKERV
jgi:O-antigen/teichoic acid export membrane protein